MNIFIYSSVAEKDNQFFINYIINNFIQQYESGDVFKSAYEQLTELQNLNAKQLDTLLFQLNNNLINKKDMLIKNLEKNIKDKFNKLSLICACEINPQIFVQDIRKQFFVNYSVIDKFNQNNINLNSSIGVYKLPSIHDLYIDNISNNSYLINQELNKIKDKLDNNYNDVFNDLFNQLMEKYKQQIEEINNVLNNLYIILTDNNHLSNKYKFIENLLINNVQYLSKENYSFYKLNLMLSISMKIAFSLD